MGMTITLLVLHVVCMILYIVNTILVDNKGSKIAYAVCAVLWGLCAILDIVKLVGMA